MMRSGVWPVRVLWLAVPFTVGSVLAEALQDTETTFRSVVSGAAWLIWAVVLLASVVTLPATLTIIRVAVPATLAVVVWAGTDVGFDTKSALGAGIAALLVVVAFLPTTGAPFIDGASYGSERRFGLRSPAALLLGPVELVWLAVVVGIGLGPLLLADSQTVAGLIAAVIGFPVAGVAFRSLVALSRRWVVFVPAGIVVHDHLALRDPVLFPTPLIDHVGAAKRDTTATDLTGRALGLAIEVALNDPVKAELTRGDESAGLTPLDGLLVTPSLPAVLLDEAESRKLAVG